MQEKNFNSRIEENIVQQARVKRKLELLGWLRVITFALGIGSMVMSNLYGYNIGYVLGAALLIAFIILVRKYYKVEEEKRYFEAEMQVLKDYLARLGEEWKQFEDNGEVFIEGSNKAKDLDLLGRASLYQYICVAHTLWGRKTLAREIVKGHKDKMSLQKRQEAVKELIDDEAFALKLQTLSMKIKLSRKEQKEENLESFIKEAEEKRTYVTKAMKIAAIILPFITAFTLVLALLGFHANQNFIIFEIGFVLQLSITLLQSGETGKIFRPLFDFNKDVSVYKDFLALMETKTYHSAYLKELQEELLVNGGAIKGLQTLNQLTDNIKVSYNFVASILLNGLFMWNIHCKDALGIWNKQYGASIRNWLIVMGEMEALLSLAVIGRVKENYCFPTIIVSQIPEVQFENMIHPLITEHKAVGNSFGMREATCIITGSNMSGKTTFLRSIGVNLALAYAGAPVTAGSFIASYMEVFTSMRIEDRVDEGISTFYAELLRIKEMIEYSKCHLPILALVDEIFKGTNSADRILGATQTIKKLGKPWINLMVTTHDFELCNLEKEEKRKTYNYHFEEYYEDNQIKFDYKLRKERCQTTNAKYLLRMVGILDTF